MLADFSLFEDFAQITGDNFAAFVGATEYLQAIFQQVALPLRPYTFRWRPSTPCKRPDLDWVCP